MRIQRLDLIKYGKFTERCVEFPAAKQDFHLLVGPNEAGKSTLRSAIVDLLFGIPARSVHSFLHPLNELRLGAVICDSLNQLEFQRAKALKQTLRSSQDAVLADSVLSAYLGSADRSFFDQMFGLDHTRLVAGGNSILNAENDVGQILFQSAAGIASLGKIREALVAEADKLWAPRKSNDRAYYLAAEQLEKASAALKKATVRTKEWVEANSKVEALQAELNAERYDHQQLEQQRNSLERIRRLAPFLRTQREAERQLALLGEVIELPKDAVSILSVAEREIAVARQRLELRSIEAESAKQALEKNQVEETVLERAVEISKLDQLRLQYSAYEKDIGQRKAEIAVLWQAVCELCTQLDWTPESQQSISQRLPKILVQRELRQLVRDHGGIIQTLRAAEQAENSKLTEIAALTKQLAELQVGEVSPLLRAALADAKSLGDSAATLRKQQSALHKAKAGLELALAELGQWRKPWAELAAIQAPSQAQISRLQQERQALIAEQKSAISRQTRQTAEFKRLELQVSQFKELHQPLTLEDVLRARQARDELWSNIKAEPLTLPATAQKFEAAIADADQVADLRTNNLEAETTLKSLSQQLVREQLNLDSIAAQNLNLSNDILQFDERWLAQAASFNLAEMPLDEIGAWLLRREKVLAAAAIEQEAHTDLETSGSALTAAELQLSKALTAVGLQIPEDAGLAVLYLQAENFVQVIDDANVRRETLSAQLLAAQSLAASLNQTKTAAIAEKLHWLETWSAALAKAGLDPESDVLSVEGRLEIIAQISEKLTKMQQIQAERIDTMQADLREFAVEAKQLMASIFPARQDEPAGQIALALANSLLQAREANNERERLTEALRISSRQVLEAQEAIQTATASLKPLLEKAGVETNAQLAEAIDRSDEQRRLTAELLEAGKQLISFGDGLAREHIAAEIDAAPIDQLAAELAKITAELGDTVQRQTELSAALANAERILADIGGSDAAALAEAQRQEALSRMSDVAERYVKVFTAERLLRWSIDRYREEKQGPLLQRASSIFATLTSGSFRKLVVDFERESMVLEGLRADGKLVGISGLSDGTRDQLYLALRLAALEMHLEQATPLPFIADDLFINYDDVRAKAGFAALKDLSELTQVIFLSHHDHLIPTVQAVFGEQVNVVYL